MYLTRLELNTEKRKTIMALASPAIFHGAIESAFVEKGGKLWRVDEIGGKRYLYLVSEASPNLSSMIEQFGVENGGSTLPYDSFLANIKASDCRRFRLTANPVISKNTGDGARGTVLAHVTVEQQRQWLKNRAEKHGFVLNEDEFTVTHSQWVSFTKGTDAGRKVTFRAVTFEGVLTVTDAELFKSTLQSGLGREKAYGCGLMTVSRKLP